jgi:hypothetical protein
VIRSVLITLGCALLVVAAYAILSPSLPLGGSALPEDTHRRSAKVPDEEPSDRPPDPVMDPESLRMLRSSEDVPVVIDDRAHGIVGEGMVELQRASQGYSIRDILGSRRQMITSAIAKVRHKLTPADVDYLVAKFNAVDDIGFRYSMLWLLRYVQDDRVVEPVASLVSEDSGQVIHTLAAIATPHAVRTLATLAADMEDPGLRKQAAQRIGKSAWKGASSWLEKVWSNDKVSADERMSALAAMGDRPVSEPVPQVMEIALGPARPLPALGSKAETYGAADLRAAAVMAAMHRRDPEMAQRLLEEADARPHDPAFQDIVDRNLVGYSGPSIVEYVVKRIKRHARVTWGEAVYLSNHCRKHEVETLQEFLRMATDPRVRGALEAAIVRAERRN